MNYKFLFLLLIVLCAAGLSYESAKADGIIIPEPPICDDCQVPEPMSQLEIRYHHVKVTIEDQIAITHVDQVFYNPNDWAVEGIYAFPIPLEAVVSDFILWMDGEQVHGEVLTADKARETYERIVANLRDPALLEYADMGVLKASIFPIPPMGERRIELEYTQSLTADNGLVRYLYPLSTEKFSRAPLEEVSVTVSITATQPIRAVYSPSHPVDIRRESDYQVLAGYEAQDIIPDQDFSLFYSLGESEAFHLMTFRDPSDRDNPDGFFLLLLAPAIQESSEAIPKDILIVLDHSGSMEGEKFEQAQEAVRYILNKLNPGDRFNLVSFSTGIEVFANDVQPISAVDEAAEWVTNLRAGGSTDINRALLEAASLIKGDRPTYLVFLTDGLPTVGEVDSEKIIANFAAATHKNLSLFSFGVGYDVDTYLLDSLAQAHHGNSTYVVPGEALNEALSSFYNKIRTPVLVGLSLDFGDLVTSDIYPYPLPDLFSGTQVAVVGRYREGGTHDVTLSGLVDGGRQNFIYPDQEFDLKTENLQGAISSIPRLWATRKIGYLLQEIRLRGPEREIIDEIVRLSIRYGVVTPYTSYLVTEPMPLEAEVQERIAAEEFNKFSDQATMPTFGQEAVERAEGQSSLANAEAVTSPSAETIGKVRSVGSHTFILSEQTWIDTLYVREEMEVIELNFLSDEYFRIAQQHPEIGDAFALGKQVIVVAGDIAYRVIDKGSQGIQSEETQLPHSTGGEYSAYPAGEPQMEQQGAIQEDKSGNISVPCFSALMIIMVPLMILEAVKSMSKIDKS